MSRGYGGGAMPFVLLVVLALTITIGVIIFGSAMQSVYVESNYTAEQKTLVPYELQSGWWAGIAILILVLAIAFAFYKFWG